MWSSLIKISLYFEHLFHGVQTELLFHPHFAVVSQYKICSWLAIIFCAQSLANMRNLENDLKQISMAMMYVPLNSFFSFK